eukprot:2438745-Rhodomonas_salina.1
MVCNLIGSHNPRHLKPNDIFTNFSLTGMMATRNQSEAAKNLAFPILQEEKPSASSSSSSVNSLPDTQALKRQIPVTVQSIGLGMPTSENCPRARSRR